jgi:hypothetical protein
MPHEVRPALLRLFKEHPAAAGDMISIVFLHLQGLIRFPDLAGFTAKTDIRE